MKQSLTKREKQRGKLRKIKKENKPPKLEK
jgi:hypothetical protein